MRLIPTFNIQKLKEVLLITINKNHKVEKNHIEHKNKNTWLRGVVSKNGSVY